MAGRMDDKKLRCSFCNKTQDQVRKLIAGPNGAYICDPEAQAEIGGANFYMQPINSPVMNYVR